MTSSQGPVLEALRTAVQMEIDGKKFYLKASDKANNALGKRLLAKLASEEDIHRRRFKELYDALKAKKGWKVSGRHFAGGNKLKNLFSEASKDDAKLGSQDELDAIDVALGMEKKSYDFYKKRSDTATSSEEKEYYEKVAGEEMLHSLLLTDYSEYLKDPAAWFVNKEHPSLDGG